jgi:D-alanyl-D-alanine carboxypeptidase
MRTISRREFVPIVAFAAACAAAKGLPFLNVADAAATRDDSLTRWQIKAAESVLRRLVFKNAVPGISYSIGNTRGILAEGAFGLRVVRPPVLTNSHTRCALASVSKQFASAAVYLLHQRGELSLDAPLSDYVPDYVHASEMTLYQVLTMRSGIGLGESCEVPIDGEIDESTLIANLNQEDLEFTGQYFTYSNCGYNLAGVVVARVSGMSYGRFIQENFFRPLGMASSYRLGTRSDPNFAQGYAPEGHRWKTESFTAADAAFASGNLVSNPADMQRWDRSLLNATLLSRRTLRKIFTVPATPDSAISRYASGWFVEPSGVIWHGGTLAGYGTCNTLFPMTGHAITVLANTPRSDRWQPGDTALEVYNSAALGPRLPPLLPVVHTTKP